MRSTYHDTVKAFAAAIDCKGQKQRAQRRVGNSLNNSLGAGWANDEVEGVAVAGYLHA